jgi:hypothetical protein
MAKVEALTHHTFSGKDYAPGDTYTVKGDAHQTEDQYVDTLRGSGLARPVGEGGPNVVQEVGSEPAPKPAASHPVAPLGTETVTPEPLPAKPAKAAKAAKAPKGATAAKKK